MSSIPTYRSAHANKMYLDEKEPQTFPVDATHAQSFDHHPGLM